MLILNNTYFKVVFFSNYLFYLQLASNPEIAKILQSTLEAPWTMGKCKISTR